MKFSYAGSLFTIEFQRQKKQVTVNRKGNKHTIESKYPYTTARLLESKLNQDPQIIYEATVGCVPTDHYSNAKGRIAALRALTDKVQAKGLRAVIWDTYQNRGESNKS